MGAACPDVSLGTSLVSDQDAQRFSQVSVFSASVHIPKRKEKTDRSFPVLDNQREAQQRLHALCMQLLRQAGEECSGLQRLSY